MSNTITVRLSEEQAHWLKDESKRLGVAQGAIIRDQLEAARSGESKQAFMRLAGRVSGPKNLSARKGFSKK